MAHAQTSPVGHFIRRLSVAHLVAAVPDDELVERFAVHREEAAFAALVRRHGPLVLGVCRRVLTDAHAAEDCFQATFLVLARKAGSLKGPQALGPWLYGVATRTALKARARAARRRVCERRAAVAEAVAPSDGLVWRDLRPKLDEAIAGLPEKYRTAFVLHHLEGLTVAEVAHRLGCPQGTTAARLARAKEQLRARLARRGLGWCFGALATALAQGAAPAAVPAPLAAVTVQAAMLIAAGEVAGALSATAAALISGGLRVMSVSKVKVALAVLLTVSALGVGLGVFQPASPGGGHAGVGRATTPGARQASGRQRPGDDALAFGRYYAGGFHSLRGFEFRGVPPKAGSAESGCEEPDAPDRESKDSGGDLQEQPTGSLTFGLGVNSDAGLTGSVVRDERNFDILRSPTRFADLFSGNAFRGAGQEFRMEAVPDTLEGFKLGGDFLFLNSIEYQVPVRANDGIFLDAFVDNGTAEQKVEIEDYRVSAGFGIRFVIPKMGPVPIAPDFAFPPARRFEAPKRLFSFGVGCSS
jgi:RNA polymerase sigma factor (sigma-70 family)